MPRYVFLCLVTAIANASANSPVTRLKDLHIQTTLASRGQARGVIVSPAHAGYDEVAKMIQSKIGGMAGVRLDITNPAGLSDDVLKGHNVILLGNAPDNEFVRRLVWERWIFDTWYPGDEGYVVRSIHNPFGHGKNIIFVGGENAATVRAAAVKFINMLKPADPLNVGWIMTFETDKRGETVTQATVKRCTEQAEKALGFKNGRGLISMAASMARRYYSTGQDSWAELFKVVMSKHQALGQPGMGTHMNVYAAMSQWEVIEESPVFSDDDRLFITNHLLYILRSKEGCMNGFFQRGTKQQGVRHNHQTLPGLACLFGGRYFKLGYGLPEADEWLAAGRKLFGSQKISHKPQCDCNCYEWGTLYQTGWWSLGSGDYTFFKNGTCRAAADRAIIEMDNRGYSSCNGDFWSLYYFPTVLFQQAAAYYRDGRYEWAIRKRHGRRGVANLVRGVEPEEPTDLLGIQVAPMSPHFFNAHHTTMPSQPKPNIPIERSFDKISFRRTFDPEDQYLLLDGIGTGSHGHVDVNGISQFTDNSRIWLMDVSYAEAPNMRDHNVVTVMRNGETAPPPPFTALDGFADLETVGFSMTSLAKYCGVDWHRHLFWLKERCFLFVDQLIAREPGDYTLRAHWRTPGKGQLEGTTFSVQQQAEATATLVRQITRQDGEGDGKCMKIVHPEGALARGVHLTVGRWTVTVVGCGHHAGDDSFYLHLDGKRISTAHVSRTTISPANPLALRIMRDGEHEVKLTLRESPGTICDKLVLDGPKGRQIVIDALDMQCPTPPPGRIDSFTLACSGADKASLTLDTENVGKWFKRYEYTAPIASIVQQSKSIAMEPGDEHSIANVFFASNATHPINVQMRRLSGRAVLLQDGSQIACLGIGPVEITIGDARVGVAAKQFLLAADRLAVHAATDVTWRGSLLSTEKPVSVEKAVDDQRDARLADLQEAWDRAATQPQTPAAATATRGMVAQWTSDVGAPVLSMAQGDVDADGATEIALGCEDGTVRLLSSEGKLVWQFRTGGRVSSVAIADVDGDGKGEILAGSDDRCCYLLNADGSERWHYEGAEGDDPYWRRYWKTGEVEKVLAADIDGDGKKEVVFAAANMNVHACDIEGHLLWRFRQYGVCTSLLATDLNRDGKMEIVGGPAKITCYSNCHVIDQTGKSISRFGNDGWASALTAICTADLDGDGVLEVVCGTNMNNVYALNAADRKLTRRWKYTAGDVINSLCAVRLAPAKAQHVIAASASEYVYALNAEGDVTWTANLRDSVTHVAARDINRNGRDEVVALTLRSLYVLDTEGHTVASFAARAVITCSDLGAKMLLATRDGRVQQVALHR